MVAMMEYVRVYSTAGETAAETAEMMGKSKVGERASDLVVE